ncbi:hypothetical protein [Mycobacterium sp. E136]|uniref:hypothetical protein n=1 Tax=Mycobacterium sp. E136 TaxID=1834125 RepID=UPI0012E77C44|nr:hypothetical protein [Mycobacterium sp. E136]
MFVRSTLLAAVAVAGSLTTGAHTAAAQTQDAQGGCQPALSAPELVMLANGAKAVRARLTMATCSPDSQPTDVVVCLEAANGRSECKKLPGWSNVHVMMAATPPDGAFTATGQVCWFDTLKTFNTGCRAADPITVTF